MPRDKEAMCEESVLEEDKSWAADDRENALFLFVNLFVLKCPEVPIPMTARKTKDIPQMMCN